MGNVTIRTLIPEDWEIFREVRIRALTLHPQYFSQTVDDSMAQPRAHWQSTLDNHGKRVLGLFNEGNLIGITAVFTWRERQEGDTGLMAMSFIEPEYRGNKYSDLFYEERIKFAISHTPWKTLHIAHREGNEPSKRAILRNGFSFIGTNNTTWPDGTCAQEYIYEMCLETLRA